MTIRLPRKSFAFALALMLGLASAISADNAPVPGTKTERYDRMIVLSQQIEALKAQSGTAAQRQLADAQTELMQISASLGGDLPCPVGVARTGVASFQSAPTVPSGCTGTTTVFSNVTPVAIPTGPATVTSTIVVSGAGNYLWDVDVQTFIRHTFSADIDMTITSPSGTVVTLTTDNGGSNDDVFNGTVWDDSADPGSQVPYTSNDGLVTDHVYANGVLASPLVPEGSLAKFVGENPNGIWTLTINDDLAGDGGSLDQWSLNLTTFAAAPIQSAVQSFTQSTPVAIPTGPAVVSSTLVVSGLANPVCKVSVRTNITHTFSADIDMTLQSPNGTVITLTTDNGGSNDDIFNGTVWDSSGPPVTDYVFANAVVATLLSPEESLGALMGENGNGTWTLTVSDDLSGDGGNIASWGLDLVTCTCASADLSASVTAAPGPVTAGNNLTYTATATNNGPSAADTVSITLPLPVGTSFVSVTPSAGGTCNAASPVVCSWPGSTANATSVTATVVATVAASVANGTNLAATVTVASTTSDPAMGNNTATANTTVATSADLSITLAASPPSVIVGTNLTFLATLSNAGPSDAQGVSITLPLPAGTSFVSATPSAGGTCNAASPVICSWAGATPPGTNRTTSIVALAGPSLNNGAQISATATAASSTSDPVAGNNSSSGALAANNSNVAVPGISGEALLLLSLMLGLLGLGVVRRQT